jgi:hypothetical protein
MRFGCQSDNIDSIRKGSEKNRITFRTTHYELITLSGKCQPCTEHLLTNYIYQGDDHLILEKTTPSLVVYILL